MALVKPIQGPFGVIASYFRVIGAVLSISDEMAIVKVGAYTNRASREENALPIPLFFMEYAMTKNEGYHDGLTVAEMYAFVKTKEEFADAVFEGSPKPEVEQYPTLPEQPTQGASDSYLAEREAAKKAVENDDNLQKLD